MDSDTRTTDFDLAHARRVAEIIGSQSAAAQALDDRERRIAAGEGPVIIYGRGSWFVVPRSTDAPKLARSDVRAHGIALGLSRRKVSNMSDSVPTSTTVARYRPRGAFYCGHTDEFWLTCWMRTHGWTRDQAEGCLRDVLVSGRMEVVP
jgi:hypothetical protein